MLQVSVDQAMRIAIAHQQAGRFSDAETIHRQILASHPNHVESLYHLSQIYSQTGRPDQALELMRRAIAIAPVAPDLWIQQGFCQRSLSQWQEALASFHRALTIRPLDAQLLFILGNTYQSIGQHDRAIEYFERSLAIKPDRAELMANMGSAYRDTGQIDRAIACYRRTLELNPEMRIAHDNLMMALLYQPASTARTLFSEALHWNATFAKPLAPLVRPHRNNRDPDRSLRIGYVSPDLANHPVGRFMLPLLANHQRTQFQIFCYSQIQKPDEMTARLRSLSPHWHNIVALSDDQVAEQIRDDQIDILVDLALHSAKNRSLVFARKPAPIQVAYLGYAGGCGLDTIDYRLTDRYLEPDGSGADACLQQTFALAGTYWCYQRTGAPLPVAPLPATSCGHVTLGCLNNFPKVTSTALETWATILKKLPTARLLLHAPPGSSRDRLLSFFEAKEIDPSRLEFTGRIHPDDYFKTYDRIDIALDPYPYAGGTTTCDALWMGVPVVTLAGLTPVGRAGVSILNNASFPQWIARDTEAYVKIVTDLVSDLPRLAEIRSLLRLQLQRSSLMDAVGYTQSIESAYRTMWQTWCRSR